MTQYYIYLTDGTIAGPITSEQTFEEKQAQAIELYGHHFDHMESEEVKE